MLSQTERQKSALHIRSILVPTDLGPSSELAVQLAQTFALWFSAELHIVYVVASEAYPLAPPPGVSTVHDIGMARAKSHFEQIKTSSRNLGIAHDVVIREGEIWNEVKKSISENHVDLIVLGTHGASGFEKLALGSVAEEIFRKAPCMVMTVGPRVSSRMVNSDRFREVLFATDFSPQSQAALPVAILLAAETKSHLTLLHVVDESKASDGMGESALTGPLARQLLRMMPDGAAIPGILVESGDPADVTTRIAAEMDCGLIVLGVHRAESLACHMPWSVASRIVRNAVCPVLTVRSRPEGSPLKEKINGLVPWYFIGEILPEPEDV
jgi:nucleotide-binding universal stress UspA family protein